MAETDKGRGAAYIPWKSLLTATEVLEQGLPQRLDRSVFPSFSGSIKSWVLSAFIFLDFTDGAGNVKPRLELWVQDEAQRKRIMHDVLEEKYAGVIALAKQPGTPQQFREEIEKLGVSGTTTPRAMRFFLSAANFADVSVPESWKKATAATKSGGRRRRIQNNGDDHRDDVEDTPPPSQGDTLQLESGGTVTLSIDANLLDLSPEDRDWLFELIDHFRQYESASGDDSPTPAEQAAV